MLSGGPYAVCEYPHPSALHIVDRKAYVDGRRQLVVYSGSGVEGVRPVGKQRNRIRQFFSLRIQVCRIHLHNRDLAAPRRHGERVAPPVPIERF